MKFFTQAITAAALLTGAVATSHADTWEPCLIGTNALKVYNTTEGVLLSSDYDYLRVQGGIYYSEDQGDTWVKSNAPDHFYWDFCESEDYIWAPGFSCRVARSEDGGRTWLTLSFQSLAEEHMDNRELEALDNVQCYSAYYDSEKARLFVAVFSQSLGVIYSDDDGETWQITDPKGMVLSYDAEKDEYVYDNIYTLVKFNGKLYALGMAYHYEYDYESNGWTRTRDDNGDYVSSNFLGVYTIMNNSLYAARAMEDTDMAKPFISVTDDMSRWYPLPRPDDSGSNYVSNMANDGKFLYALSFHEGLYYTDDEGINWGWLGMDGYPEADPMQFQGTTHPTGMAVTDDYVFICLWELSNPNAGVYRIPRPTEISSLTKIEANGLTVTADGSTISVDGTDSAEITVTAMTGANLLSASGTSVSVEALPAGVYIFKVTAADGRTATGKFLRK